MVLATIGAHLVPILIPDTGRTFSPLNWKLFLLRTNSKSLIKKLLERQTFDSGLYLFSIFLAAKMEMSLGTWVYNWQMSVVTIRQLSGTWVIFSNSCSRWVVSLMYAFMLKVHRVRKWSTNCEIFSVEPPFAETIGLPGGGKTPLCILRSK